MDGVGMGAGVLVFLVALALLFGFLNGFHDTANSIATVVSTGVLRPSQAVLWTALFNVLALVVFELGVAATVGTGIVDAGAIDHHVVFGALVAAIAWNLVTGRLGLPSSSSHALIGGLVGATLAAAGNDALVGSGVLTVAAFIVLSPMLGFVLAIAFLLGVSWLFARASPRRMDRWFRHAQLVSSALYSIGHGSNDAQKSIGVIWLLLIVAGRATPADLPGWVAPACYLTLGLGTLIGGWRIIRTMGLRVTPLRPPGAFCAETGGALALFVASAAGIPVSTTQTFTGAIVGVGAVRKFSAVRWGLAGRIVWTWIVTLPAVAFIAALGWALGRLVL